MIISNRENKKGKGIAFKSTYKEEATVNHSDNEANMDESIALLTKQFSKGVRRLKNMNTAGLNAQTSNQYRRKDGENATRRYNEASNRRNGDYGKKKEGEGRFFRCRECGGVGHYQAECPTILRGQKKDYHATLSDEDTDDTKDDSSMNAFTACFTAIDFEDDSECSDEVGDEDLTFKDLKMLRKEDTEAKAIQKEIIQDLMEKNERLMKAETEATTAGSPHAKSPRRICYYCRQKAAVRINDKDDETLNMHVDTSMLLVEVPKVDTLPNGTDINSETISKEVIVDNSELVPSAHVRKNHPPSSMICDPSTGIITKKKEKVDYSKMIVDLCYTSAIESSTIDVALKDKYWINAMQEKLLQFKHNNVWTLVPKPGANIIGKKWILKNKTDEVGCVTKNKARLVA
ncbi:putative mitochondrial protein [Cucumis melo var. makuwa]|uniref:Mitochondrial protein n=1 Tax=Cucumis melo var. makuwa TaxID=1194695 RepID=A0A5A7VEW7_CUCMM|nr:putative mitochondrial protein [Cucumis melo var. makuwa]TYK24053.1 putative mitochondrial protein [Cucumis melo var. makuwa]